MRAVISMSGITATISAPSCMEEMPVELKA